MEREKLSRIVGLRLLAIKEGVECGAIREVVIDVEKKAVEYLVLDTGTGCFGFCVLPNEKIEGMGKDFAITGTREYVSSIWQEENAMRLAYTDSDLIGARVVSSAGDVIGKIVDFEFELIEGDIEKYIMEDGGVLPKECIVTLSRGIVFIDSDQLDGGDADDGDAPEDAEEEPAGEAEEQAEEAADEPAAQADVPQEEPAAEEPAQDEPAGEEPAAQVEEQAGEAAEEPAEEPAREEEAAAPDEPVAEEPVQDEPDRKSVV